MFTRIVVGVDGSRISEGAAQAAISLAARSEAQVHLVSVIEELPRYISAREEVAREEAEARQYFTTCHQRWQQEAERKGVTLTTHLMVGHEVQQLLTALTTLKADLLVIGHAGHSAVWGTGLGSTASQLLRHAPCSVLIVRTHAPALHLARLVVALDGSPLGWEAYAVALDLARHTRHPLHVLSVAGGRHGAGTSEAEPQARAAEPSRSWVTFLLGAQARAAASAAAAGVDVEIKTQTGPVSETLVAAARDVDADVLILGATGHEHPWSQTTGAIAVEVAEGAPCAVLVVRPPRSGAVVRDVMMPASVVAQLEDPLSEALSLLLDDQARLIPVVSPEGTVSGVITLSRLLRQLDPALAAHLAQLSAPAQVRTHLEHMLEGRTARESMLSNPYVLQMDVPLTVAGRYLTTHGITRAPVIDASRRLVGILGEHEVVSALIAPASQQAATPQGTKMPAFIADAQALTAGMLTDQTAPKLAESASADEVVSALQATPNRLVLVVGTAGQFRGLIDERVLLQRMLVGKSKGLSGALQHFFSSSQAHPPASNQPGEPLTAASLMRPGVPVVTGDTLVTQALAQLITSQSSDVGVVVAPDGQPVGILWRHLALRALLRG
jgi:nucleotide-binding universal stress UspA family protein/CBS-domain-containing membrane protein